MAPINADVAEVEAQLSAIRSRRNGLVAQRALACALSVALLAAAMVVATALRANQTVFVVAVAVAAVTSVAAAAYAAWRTRGEWLSLTATARLADVHAALEERLTTLLAIARIQPRPALSALLIMQIVGARDRWGVQALAPKRLSPWLALVPLSILVFAATAFYARPPAAIGSRNARLTPPSMPARSLAGAESQPPQDGLFTRDDGALAMAGGARGDTTEGGIGGGDGGKSSAGAAAEAVERSQMMGAADGGAAPGELGADGGLANLRRSIRETFGADQDGANAADGKERKGRGNAGADRDPGSGDTAKPPQQAAAGVGEANGERTDNRSASSQSITPNPARNTADQGARGSGRGGAGNAGSTGVLGANGSQRIEPDASAAVALKLKAISGVSPSQNEPQRRSDGMPAVAAAGKSAEHPLPDLAGEQVADVTMQQPDIGPEHEAIVRRLFSRE